MSSTHSDGRMDRWLVRVFFVLTLLTVSQLAISFASIPIYYQRVITQTVPTINSSLSAPMSNAEILTRAYVRGMSLQTYAVYRIIVNLIVTLVFLAVAFFVALKAQGKWFHWFTAFVLAFIPTGSLFEFTQVSQIFRGYVGIGSLFWPLFLLYLFLFPNGVAVPRWARWPIAVFCVFHFSLQALGYLDMLFASVGKFFGLLQGFAQVLLIVFPLILICQFYRYLRVSTPTERLQTQWVIAGLGIYILLSIPLSLLPGDKLIGDNGFRGDLDQALLAILPITIDISILKYRLFEINLIIRKTLVYASLTAILGLVYFGSVIVFQKVFRDVVGQTGQSSLSIVLSTLVTAFLFTPLRQRIQELIDRGFYRKRYDAEQTIQSFAAAARDEVDLARISNHLTSLVEETMQPRSVSLWLRAREKPEP
ncbi:MAG TPA: hypothetical protein VMT46_03930 [Anaerolineaceae bacterium]|nr:hypothetical protein [Anaerolineaceae bacterium]